MVRSHLEGFYGLTLGNCEHVLEDRWRLWLAVVFTYAFTAAAIYLATREARHYLRLRREYLRRGDGAGESPQPRCSVLVERVPPRLRSDAALHQYFAALFGHRDVHSAVSFVDCAHLEKVLDARDAAADAYAWRSEEGGYGHATITSLTKASVRPRRDLIGEGAGRAKVSRKYSGGEGSASC